MKFEMKMKSTRKRNKRKIEIVSISFSLFVWKASVANHCHGSIGVRMLILKWWKTQTHRFWWNSIRLVLTISSSLKNVKINRDLSNENTIGGFSFLFFFFSFLNSIQFVFIPFNVSKFTKLHKKLVLFCSFVFLIAFYFYNLHIKMDW